MLGEFTERYNELFLKHLLCQLSLLLENLHLLWLVKHYHPKKNLNSSTELPKQKNSNYHPISQLSDESS